MDLVLQRELDHIILLMPAYKISRLDSLYMHSWDQNVQLWLQVSLMVMAQIVDDTILISNRL